MTCQLLSPYTVDMPETPWLNRSENRAWRGYQQMSVQLEALLHRTLVRETGLSLSDYEVLVHLSESPEGMLRAFELGSALQWEKSRLSHHLRRMEKRGLIERQTCDSDGRGLFVVLTGPGREAIEAAAPSHVADVRRYLIDILTPQQLETLTEISEKVLAGFPSDHDVCDD